MPFLARRHDLWSAAPAAAVACAGLLFTQSALADRIALLPSRGGDAGLRTAVDGDLAAGLRALGHTLVPAGELSAALAAKVTDGVADTQEEYRAVGAATRADWVIVGAIDPVLPGASPRVELTACLLKAGRVETVARAIDRAREPAQTKAMLGVLVRAEGIGAGALPWEQGAPAATPKDEPAPATDAPVVEPVEDRAHVSYPVGSTVDVWPPYSGGRRGFLALAAGYAIPALRPAPGVGVTSRGDAFVGAVRGGYAAGDRGLELFAELGGDVYGPRALWVEGGLRWMLSPTLRRGADGVRGGAPFFLGPELFGGAFVELPTGAGPYSAPAEARGMLGGAIDVSFALAPSLTLEAHLGNLRWVPGGSGALLFAGADLGAAVRF